MSETEYIVQPRECVYSIAHDHGFCWRTIWDHPSNEALRDLRQDPAILLDRDRIYIPQRRLKQVGAATGKRHSFLRRGEPTVMSVQVCRFGQPAANRRFAVEVDGAHWTGHADENGMIQLRLRPSARRATLRVEWDAQDQLVYELVFGRVDPITELSGVQTRLVNLGYDCEITGKLDDRTVAAISRFQRDAGLPVTGEPDDMTRRKLPEIHLG